MWISSYISSGPFYAESSSSDANTAFYLITLESFLSLMTFENWASPYCPEKKVYLQLVDHKKKWISQSIQQSFAASKNTEESVHHVKQRCRNFTLLRNF